jgi:hypothetical protein
VRLSRLVGWANLLLARGVLTIGAAGLAWDAVDRDQGASRCSARADVHSVWRPGRAHRYSTHAPPVSRLTVCREPAHSAMTFPIGSDTVRGSIQVTLGGDRSRRMPHNR